MLRGSELMFLFLIQFLFLNFSNAQVKSENSPEELIVRNAATVYFKSLGEQAGIYRGVAYTGFPYRLSNGHQYFETQTPKPGSVYYDGILYKDIPMWYDLVKNQVIVQFKDGFSEIKLHNELIDYFSIHDHHFVHLGKEKIENSTLSEGFYDLVYDGRTQVLVKRSKGTLKEVSGGFFIKILKQKNEFYLMKEGIYIPLKNQTSVLSALGNKQKELQEFLKKSNVKFRKDPENAIVRMVRYHDLLTGIK
jgi:hypothetical protein